LSEEAPGFKDALRSTLPACSNVREGVRLVSLRVGEWAGVRAFSKSISVRVRHERKSLLECISTSA
jgi:hypothetical protein